MSDAEAPNLTLCEREPSAASSWGIQVLFNRVCRPLQPSVRQPLAEYFGGI
jgi:hypothetical protein